MAQEYARRVRLLPGYGSSAVTEDELQETARGTLDLMIRQLSQEQVDTALASRSESIGRRRARQGLALDSLTRAVRMDFRFVWEVLRAEAEDDELLALGDEVATVWEVVELHTSRIQAAFISELADLNRELEIERGSLLRRLLMDEISDDVQLGHIAVTFGWQRTSELHVVVPNRHSAQRFRDAVRRDFPAVDIHLVEGTECVIVERAGYLARQEAWHSLPAGISPSAGGLHELPAAWDTAKKLASLTSRDKGAAVVETHWPGLFEAGIGRGLELLRAQRLRELDALPSVTKDTLISTFHAFTTSGSVSEVAAQQFLHRNSVLKRLQRLSDLTGLDPRIPDEASLLLMLVSPHGRGD